MDTAFGPGGYASPVWFGLVIVGIVDVRLRSHGNIELFAVRRERQIARGVAAASALCAGKYFFDDCLGLPPWLHISIAIRKAQHGICVADVHPFRIRPGRIERDSKRLPESGGKCLALLIAISPFNDPGLKIAGLSLAIRLAR